jgi:hypothetical protein
MMGRLVIWSVAVLPSALNVNPSDGTGVSRCVLSNAAFEKRRRVMTSR